MSNMSNIINATPNEDGRIILELYGQEIEIDDSMFNAKGVAIIKKFGQEYEIHKPVPKTRKKVAEVAAKEETPTETEPEKAEDEEAESEGDE